MKKIIGLICLSFIVLTTIIHCSDYDDEASATPIQNFIWKGLNLYYLYQPQVGDLSDSKFANQRDLDTYLGTYPKAEDLFDHLIYDRAKTDKYSVLFSNYTQLEELLNGISKSDGLEYGLKYKTGSTTDIFGWVKYIMPNTDASTKPIQRGTIFYGVNGTQLTTSNYRTLLGADTYTLNLADYDNGNITPNGQSVSLTKSRYTENPVLVKNVQTIGAKKVGYLLYNGFYADFDSELNSAFAYFKAENITDFVLDLRYNSGGSIATATALGSMITGQFNGQLFAKQQWNSKLEPKLNPSSLVNNFGNILKNGEAINSINMSKVYILTADRTASASELVINCLKPYITVVQIGTTTVGKNVGSITLYDSPNFRKEGANPNHKYAMQPIVLKVLNKDGFGEYQAGIIPETANTLAENLGDLGTLGDPNELLLAKALNLATQKQAIPKQEYAVYKTVEADSKGHLDSEMYLDEVPKELVR
jgi:carboxyl-terminal processing protease